MSISGEEHCELMLHIMCNVCKGPELKVLLVCLRSNRVVTVARSKREGQ